jgi:hypothetical protein
MKISSQRANNFDYCSAEIGFRFSFFVNNSLVLTLRPLRSLR